MMQFKPSDIMFSQDSISNYFAKRSRHNGVLIGKTLDDLCEGRCRVAYIPTIKVLKKDGKWVTADNRRLWVFRECERLGKCDKIPVRQTLNIPQSKMNSPNGGVSVKVRGNPGGLWHNRPTVRRQESQGTSVGDPKPNVYVSPSPFSNVLALSVVTQTTSTPDTLTSSSSTYSRPICCDQEPENRMHSSVQFVTETTNLAVAESTPATVLSNLPSEPKNGDSSISKCADHGYPRTLKKRKRRTRRIYIEEADIFQSSAIVFAVYEETRLSDSKSAKTSGSKTNKVRKIIKPVRRSTRLSLQNLPSVLKDKKDIYKSLSEVPKRMGSLFQPNNFLCA